MNKTIYYKLLLQAEEAKYRGFTKLADNILKSISLTEEPVEYSYSSLHDDVVSDIWKLASHVINYYNLESVDGERLDQLAQVIAGNVIRDLEVGLGVDSVIKGPLEPKVPGEVK